MAETQLVGRIGAQDRPGLVTWFVASVAARDALTTLGDADETQIAEADIGRVARVGSEPPYRYFELIAVAPLGWAEIGAGVEIQVPSNEASSNSDPGTPFIMPFYVPLIPTDEGSTQSGSPGLDGNGVLGMFRMPPIEGAMLFDAEHAIGSSTGGTSTDNISVSVNQFAAGGGTGEPSFTDLHQDAFSFEKNFAVNGGDLVYLTANFFSGNTSQYRNIAISFAGIHDKNAPPKLNGNRIDPLGAQSGSELAAANTLYLRPIFKQDDSGIAGVFPGIGSVPTGGDFRYRAFVFAAEENADGSYQPGEMLATATGNLAEQANPGAGFALFDEPVPTEGVRYLYTGVVLEEQQSVGVISDVGLSNPLDYSATSASYNPESDDGTGFMVNVSHLTVNEARASGLIG